MLRKMPDGAISRAAMIRGVDPRVTPATGLRLSACERVLARLPFTREEANGIQRIAGARANVVTDFSANRDFIMGPALENYQFVHLATHALVNVDRAPPAICGSAS